MPAVRHVLQPLLAVPEQLEGAACPDIGAHFARAFGQLFVAHERRGVNADLRFRPHQRARIEPAEREGIGDGSVAYRSFLTGVGAARRDRRGELGFGLELLIEARFALVVERTHDQETVDVAKRADALRSRFLVAASRSGERGQHTGISACIRAELLAFGRTEQRLFYLRGFGPIPQAPNAVDGAVSFRPIRVVQAVEGTQEIGVKHSRYCSRVRTRY